MPKIKALYGYVLIALIGLVLFQNCSRFQSALLGSRPLSSSNSTSLANQWLSPAVWTDLASHYWVGPLSSGYIRPSWWGYVSGALATSAGATAEIITDVENAEGSRGTVWDRSTVYHFMFFYQQLTGSTELAQSLAAEWTYFKTLYTSNELSQCGINSVANFGIDDTGWNSLYLLEMFRITGDTVALQVAETAVNCAFSHFATSTTGSPHGLWYSDAHTESSLYEVGLTMAAWDIYQLSGDSSFYDKFISSYTWMQRDLLRDDGLYWADFNPTQVVPLAASRPNDIHTGNSVSFLAGNMAMAVFNARLFKSTGQDIYRQRAVQTVQGILNTYVKTDGTLMDDRDAWADGTFAVQFVREVLPLQGVPLAIGTAFKATARAIVSQGRTADGYYSGDWGSGSVWVNLHSTPEQIYTSTQAALMVLAADFLTENGK